ncbi:ABC transporter ATP-binding protein [Neobacillus sp. PS3-12]|jgi:putative ABC transport system ATP-binding protein|uniref:ABC transporter ATP-binding protein n=1 Tax=Neobacillus sp. PS3-12 TaxID=3070677 RepID=UPI0027DFD062|nr:ABC transporter ATP-binding protein [Neobacillus sp. PS3-12]WML52790.1 ABC transporter ATP-binding protein [Neobacillus sp. PS3-12]
MSTPMIQISNLMKSYKLGGEIVHALNNVSLNIDKGEFLAIIGPSGSGKSTLMNMLGCLDRPDTGNYLLDGKEIGKMNDNDLATIRNHKIGFIFQNFNLLTKLTALENVELPLIYSGLSAKIRREKALESLTKVGLKDRAGHMPTQLSGGQQQRVAIARALAGNPSILLADEPTGALDTKTSAEILLLMKELNEVGNTIILITHDLSIAKQAKRMVQIQDGQLFENEGEQIGNLTIY